ncbi:MAG: cytochrome c biogenesis protein CcdA [Nanoarchaeota archaeon]
MTSIKINIWDLRILTLIVLFLAIVLAYSGSVLFPVKPAEAGIKISFILAFLGGLLALLSPCSAVILPAFFSYSFQGKKELLKMTYVFFLGLLVIFIPLGFSTSIISFLFSFYREITFIIAGAILILIGLIKLFNIHIPGFNFNYQEKRDNMTAYVFTTGMLFSFTTIACIGPIIGGITTMAVSFGFSSVMAILLLIVFALGLVTPLFILSLVFKKYDLSKSWLLKEKTIKIIKEIKFLPLNIISGIIFVLLGFTFLFYENLNLAIGGESVSNLYLTITSITYEYLIKNQIVNISLSLGLFAFIFFVILKMIRKNKKFKTKHLNI